MPAYVKPDRSNFNRLGRNPLQRLGLAPAPGWAGLPCSRLGRSPASPLGRKAACPGWAPAPGWAACPGWAVSSCAPGWAACPGRASFILRTPVGFFRSAPAGPDQEDPAWPGFPSRLPSASSGWAGLDYSGWARSVLPWPRPGYPFVGRDIYSWAGLFLSRADIYSLRDIFLVQHRLQRIVPVLGRLQARTGISFTIICWSWDASWLRPAYPSSPSQSYPQEEDKTDDMVILKTDARRRRPRTPSTDIDGTSP
jgi:hypothetical protein